MRMKRTVSPVDPEPEQELEPESGTGTGTTVVPQRLEAF